MTKAKILLIVSGILIVLAFLFKIARAEVYVISNQSNNEIYTISEKDDTVVPSGYKKDVLSGSLSSYEFEYNPVFYKFKSNKFVLNTKKISDEEKAKEETEQKKIETEVAKKTAIEKLKTLGLTDTEIAALTDKES